MKIPTMRISHACRLALAVGLAVATVSCDPGTPSGDTGYNPSGAAAALTQEEFDALPAEEQYQVASKLYGTLFRGIPADEFFDLSGGTRRLVTTKENFINDTRASLETNLSLEELTAYDRAIEGLDEDLTNPDLDKARYELDDNTDLENNQKPRQLPLARIKDYPLSRDLYVNWMAYFLANTIMYSPAEEMESTDMQDVQRMYRFLFNNINDGTPIRSMVRSNLASLSRWRVARTPQNAGLEAFENYLGLFEEAVPDPELEPEAYEIYARENPILATLPESIESVGIACRDYYLTRASDDYLIGQTDFPNTRTMVILEGNFITSCTDFYDVVAGHSLVIPRAVEVIINYFMPGEDAREARLAVSEAIVAADPETYEEIFTTILFSKEYLLNTHRPRSFEESFLPLLDTLKWDVRSGSFFVGKRIFELMASSENSRTYLGSMSWNSMSLKIGRIPSVPLDALSFANYHKAVREALFRNTAAYRGGFNQARSGLIFDRNEQLRDLVASMDLNQYLDYLFLSALQRRATADEKADLIAHFKATTGFIETLVLPEGEVDVIGDGRHTNLTRDVLDYISRLPELYYFTPPGEK